MYFHQIGWLVVVYVFLSFLITLACSFSLHLYVYFEPISFLFFLLSLTNLHSFLLYTLFTYQPFLVCHFFFLFNSLSAFVLRACKKYASYFTLSFVFCVWLGIVGSERQQLSGEFERAKGRSGERSHLLRAHSRAGTHSTKLHRLVKMI